MKRNLVSRIATAVAIVGIAGAVSACGSSNNGGATNGYGYGVQGSALSGTGATIPVSPMIQFSGIAETGADGGIIATQPGTITMQSISAPPAGNAPLAPCTLNGSYMAGRCGSWANLGMNISGSGYPGSQMQITGMINFNAVAWAYLSTILGGSGYGYGGLSVPLPSSVPYGYSGYGSVGGGVTSIQISDNGSGQIGMGVNSAQLAAQDGMQTGGAPYVLYAGWVVLTINGQQVVVPF